MTLSSSIAPTAAREDKNLRRKIGLGMAVVWVLAHLWIASPLPFLLSDVSGSWIIVNDTQHRGLTLGFALCLAFLLFEPRRLKLPPAVDLALAALAIVAGSIGAWNYAYLSENPLDPGGFSLAVAATGMALLFLACLRVFGWFGWVLLGLLALVHLVPLGFDVQLPLVRRMGWFEGLLTLSWFTRESVFGLILGLVVSFGVLFVILGVGYDAMGCGRPLMEGILRPLPPTVPSDELIRHSRIARRLWALVALYFLFGGAVFAFDATERLSFEQVGEPLVLGFLVYVVFLGVAWASQASGNVQRRQRLLRLGAGGMILGFVPILSVALSLFQTIFESLFGGLSIRLPGLAGSLVAPALFLAAALVLIVTAKGRGLRRAALVLLPIALFFWMLTVDRVSPGLSAFYAVILMLVVMAAAATSVAEDAERRGFFAGCFPTLCHGLARIMVRVVILAALYGMVVPFAYFWVTLLEVLLG